MKTRNVKNGFTLIEVLIVVAIILVLASISMRYLRQAYITANEASAVASIRSLVTAQYMYSESYRWVGFADSLPKLGPGNPATENAANLVDGVLATGEKSGYNFSITGGGDDYFLLAQPVSQDRSGVRSFCTNSEGVLRGEKGKCDMSSPIIPK